MTQETSMSKIVKIFHRQTDRPTDKPTPRSSSRSLKKSNNNYIVTIFWVFFGLFCPSRLFLELGQVQQFFRHINEEY